MHTLLLRLVPVVIILVWLTVSGYVLFFSPESLIAYVGIQNAYLFLGVLAFLSGVSIFGSIPYHLILIALASGGLNPFVLGCAATVGVLMGDSTSYLIGYQGRAIIPPRFERRIHGLSDWLSLYPRGVPVFFFLYGSLVPFSNDFVGIATGLARYPFLRVILPLGAGNLVFNVTLAFLAPFMYDVLQTFANYL